MRRKKKKKKKTRRKESFDRKEEKPKEIERKGPTFKDFYYGCVVAGRLKGSDKHLIAHYQTMVLKLNLQYKRTNFCLSETTARS